MNLADIKAKALAKKRLKAAEKAALIANDGPAFWAFIIEQNPDSVNASLKYGLGYDHLPFTPDTKKIAALIAKLIEAGKTDQLNYVLQNFTFKPGAAINAEIKEALNSISSGRFAGTDPNQTSGAEIGNQIGGFLGGVFNPILGSTTTTTVTESGAKSNGNLFVIVGVALVIITVAYFVLKPKKQLTA